MERNGLKQSDGHLPGLPKSAHVWKVSSRQVFKSGRRQIVKKNFVEVVESRVADVKKKLSHADTQGSADW